MALYHSQTRHHVIKMVKRLVCKHTWRKECSSSLPMIFMQIGSNRLNLDQPASERAIGTVILTLQFKHLVGHSNEVAIILC